MLGVGVLLAAPRGLIVALMTLMTLMTRMLVLTLSPGILSFMALMLVPGVLGVVMDHRLGRGLVARHGLLRGLDWD
jgi:hypothetical protein